MTCSLFSASRRTVLRAAAVLPLATAPLLAQPRAATPVPVVASFSLLADMLREIAPPDIAVGTLVGPDADAHVFEPTPADSRRLAQAELVVVNGLGFEGWIDRLVRVSGYRGEVVVASRGVAVRQGGHHGSDPHAWQDLAQARRYVATLADALAARWPARRAEIDARRDAYAARIEQLDQQVRARFDAVPRNQRRVITSHDAFGYFGAAYGIDFFAPQAWTTISEPSAAAVARLVRQVRAQQVRALFLENISDPRLLEAIAKETGARIGGTLYSDALSKPGGPASTYLQLIDHNARTLAAALAA